MDDEVSEGNKAALYKIAITADQSANMRKDLKKTILQTLRNLRNLFAELRLIIEEKTKRIVTKLRTTK
jgi:hypothetical protein